MKKMLVLLCLTLVMVLTGCGNSTKETKTTVEDDTKDATVATEPTVVAEPTGATEEKTYKIVYSIPGLSAPIWTAASEGFKAKAAEYGWEAEILDPNDNLEEQISQVENALTKGAQGLVITPIDGQAVSTLMGECEKSGVPVIAIDRQVTGTSVTTIEADNLNIGKALGDMYIKTLGDGNGKVLIVGGPLSSSATVNRTEGFKSAIVGKSNVEIVAESATEMDSEVVLAAITNYLQANPDINCIMSCTDYILPSIMTALDEAGMLVNVGEKGHVNVYSVDGDGYGLTQVVAEKIDATYGLDPYGWAASAVEALKTYYEGGTVESSILIAGNIVTADNFEELKAANSLWGAGSMN